MRQHNTCTANGLTIRTAPGALDEVPFKRLFRFLKENKLTIEPREDGLYIVSAGTSLHIPQGPIPRSNGDRQEV